MPLRLEVTSRHQQRLANNGLKDFGVDGGTIGRSLESDWVLQDGKRFVSSRHASIDFRSGSYYIVDTSTNGVYVNEESEPVGRGKPQRLFDGDRLRIGEYEMLVHIVDSDSTGEQLGDEYHVDPVVAAQRVEAPDLTGIEMLAEHEITGAGIEVLLSDEAEADAINSASELAAASLSLEEDDTHVPAKPAQSPPDKSQRRATAKKRPPTKAAKATTSAKAPKPTARKPKLESSPKNETPGALDAFFKGAGLSPRKLDRKSEDELLQRLGQVMREFAVGVAEQLHLRAEQKNTLRLPHTTIKRSNNNALKFSAGVDEALNNLLLRETPEYMSGVESTREAFHDIRIHNQALMNAIRIAVTDYMERLDPEELERKFHHGNKRNALIGVASKMKYWDLYGEIHEVLSRHSPGELPQLFAEELTRAYEQEEARLAGEHPASRSTVEAG